MLVAAFILIGLAWGGWLYFVGKYLGTTEPWSFEEFVLWLFALGLLLWGLEFLLDKLSYLV